MNWSEKNRSELHTLFATENVHCEGIQIVLILCIKSLQQCLVYLEIILSILNYKNLFLDAIDEVNKTQRLTFTILHGQNVRRSIPKIFFEIEGRENLVIVYAVNFHTQES